MLVAWLAPFAFVFVCLMAVSPTFREVVTLGAFQAETRPVRRQRRAGRYRLRRLLRQRATAGHEPGDREEWTVLLPLIGVAHEPVESVHWLLLSIWLPNVQLLDVRRYRRDGGICTTAELRVRVTDPKVAVNTANRLAEYAGLIPGATRVEP